MLQKRGRRLFSVPVVRLASTYLRRFTFIVVVPVEVVILTK